MSDLARLGGAEGLSAHVRAFMERVQADFVIGFLFEGVDLDRVIHHETEMAARLFGDPMPYTGKPIRSVHQRLRINQGHFRRRVAILRHVLEARDVPADLVQRWVDHQEAFREAVTVDADCVD